MALQFGENLSETLQEWSFEINPYNWCVANKTFNKSQCTIVWHAADFKISHPDEKVNDEIIEKVQDKYSKEKLMT
eukprot:15350458-Ditylum_brightwellii.AAC.1